jgi:hypothetical protein
MSSTFNMTQCLKVHEYMPGYIRDYVEFIRVKPYEREKLLLQKMT